MKLRNITFTRDTAQAAIVITPEPGSPQWYGRRREITVSPAREYQLRDGTVRPISHELAACILSRKGFAELTLKGIVIERTDIGGRRKYGHPDHPLCNDLSSGTTRRVCYVINPLDPSIVHILSDDGSYLGSLPEKSRPGALDNDALDRERSAKQRQIGRAKQLLENLHAEDGNRVLEANANRAEQILKVVQTQPLPAARESDPMPPSRMAGGIAATTERHTVNRAERHAAMTDADDAWSSPRRHAIPVAAGLDDDDNPFT